MGQSAEASLSEKFFFAMALRAGDFFAGRK